MDSNANLSALLTLSARVYTFASIDVAGSTQIKNGQNEQDIIYTFLAYQTGSRIFPMRTMAKSPPSRYGMMCRFQKPEDAALMVETLLKQLSEFNKKQNHLTTIRSCASASTPAKYSRQNP